MDESLDTWFTQEILVHERALVRFLARAWPDRSEVEDLCQETYVRVYESAAKSRPLMPRGFLFATARHLMADRVRRGKIVRIDLRGDLDTLNVLLDGAALPERDLSAQQDLWRLALAFTQLSFRHREVIWMIKVEELSQKEVARRLGITAKAVERRVARGIRQLELAYFNGEGLAENRMESLEWRRDSGQESSEHE